MPQFLVTKSQNALPSEAVFALHTGLFDRRKKKSDDVLNANKTPALKDMPLF